MKVEDLIKILNSFPAETQVVIPEQNDFAFTLLDKVTIEKIKTNSILLSGEIIDKTQKEITAVVLNPYF